MGRALRLIIIFNMNILNLESKFKGLDKREKEVRHYFNPVQKGGSKHLYINDLYEDYQYDLNMYGDDLSRFNNVTPPTAETAVRPPPANHSPTSRNSEPLSNRYSPTRKSGKECYYGYFNNMTI